MTQTASPTDTKQDVKSNHSDKSKTSRKTAGKGAFSEPVTSGAEGDKHTRTVEVTITGLSRQEHNFPEQPTAGSKVKLEKYTWKGKAAVNCLVDGEIYGRVKAVDKPRNKPPQPCPSLKIALDAIRDNTIVRSG